jgi:hypothetical protein
LGKASEIAGVSKRKFIAILEYLGNPLNIGLYNYIIYKIIEQQSIKNIYYKEI